LSIACATQRERPSRLDERYRRQNVVITPLVSETEQYDL
jgi:hypothetical protein